MPGAVCADGDGGLGASGGTDVQAVRAAVKACVFRRL